MNEELMDKILDRCKEDKDFAMVFDHLMKPLANRLGIAFEGLSARALALRPRAQSRTINPLR